MISLRQKRAIDTNNPSEASCLDHAAAEGVGVAGTAAGQSLVLSTSIHGNGVGATSSPKGFANTKELAKHFTKHKAEFGFQTEQEYLSAAQKFAKSPVGGNVLQRLRSSGERVLYNQATNEFSVIAPDDTIITYFKPDPTVHGYATNLDYFNAQ
jgi:pyocin large subunit-like protein